MPVTTQNLACPTPASINIRDKYCELLGLPHLDRAQSCYFSLEDTFANVHAAGIFIGPPNLHFCVDLTTQILFIDLNERYGDKISVTARPLNCSSHLGQYAEP